MTQAAEHWTLFPSSNVDMVLRVLNRKGDERLGVGWGVGEGRGWDEVGWLKVNMTQAAEHWTLFPSSNVVGMVLRVLNCKGDEGLGWGCVLEGVVGGGGGGGGGKGAV